MVLDLSKDRHISRPPSPTDPTPAARAYLMLGVTALCFGANAVFARLAVGEIPPMLLISLRWLAVVAILAVVAGPAVRRDWPVLRRHLRFLSLMGALGFTTFNALFYVAAHTTGAINLGIIQGTIPVFVLVGTAVAYRSPVSLRQGAGVALTVAGVAVVAMRSGPQSPADIRTGDILIVVACLLYAGYTVWLRNRPDVSALAMFSVMSVAAFLSALPLAGIELALGLSHAPTATGWYLVLAIALLPSLLAQVLFIRGVQVLGPARAGVFVNLVPVIAAIMAVLFLGEQFTGFHAVALVLVLIGIGLSERGRTT